MDVGPLCRVGQFQGSNRALHIKSFCLSYSLSCVVWGPGSYIHQPVEENRGGGGGGLEDLVYGRESEGSACGPAGTVGLCLLWPSNLTQLLVCLQWVSSRWAPCVWQLVPKLAGNHWGVLYFYVQCQTWTISFFRMGSEHEFCVCVCTVLVAPFPIGTSGDTWESILA